MAAEISEIIEKLLSSDCKKLVISKPAKKDFQYKKIIIEKKDSFYQIAQYTEKQVFHENVDSDGFRQFLSKTLSITHLQLNGWCDNYEHILLISKKGVANYKRKKIADTSNAPKCETTHNHKKNYLLEEHAIIPPLIDMGVFTKEGRVVQSMYDKYKQINRFLELIDDAIREDSTPVLRIIDFGCGKSYLTFILYYYLTEIKKRQVEMIGLDLKADVIQKCNEAAKKYGYEHLHFELGDINGYHCPFEVDMVITLHACDMATDYALFNAIRWNARMIFSVPCCHHQLNGQNNPAILSILSRYGIIKERFSALATDAIRANLLTCMGYKTQVLEFIDLAHTPKNILIRAIKNNSQTAKTKQSHLQEVHALMDEFDFYPKLYELLEEEQLLPKESI